MKTAAALPALLVLAALLAGCAQEPDDDPLFGLCPHWVQGPGGDRLHVGVLAATGNATTDLAPPGAGADAGNWTHDGRPLDLYRLRLENLTLSGARLEVRATSGDGRDLSWRDYRRDGPQVVPVLVVSGDRGDEGQEFDLLLSGLHEGAAAAPGPARVEWSLDPPGSPDARADLDIHVTYHYRVCGAPL